jgi:hypothetical protein
MAKKVVFCIPVVNTLHAKTRISLLESLPLIEDAGWEHGCGQTLNNPYISGARADMLRKAIDAKADQIIFIDYDVAWRPEDMLKLLETEGDVIAGTYRYRMDDVQYMGMLELDVSNHPIVRDDGCVKAKTVPAGFLRVSREAVSAFARKYPELLYGDPLNPYIDLFNHGARDGIWWGEDMAFSDRWCKMGRELWIIPDMDIDHYDRGTGICYPGNFHKYLRPVGVEEVTNGNVQKSK